MLNVGDGMVTGFKSLDKIFDIAKSQLILMVGESHFVSMLSGDIANNICLNQSKDVLEIVGVYKKEYLIKRLFVNEAEVSYRDWTIKNKYSDQEYSKIGKSVVNLIEVTKSLPQIIDDTCYEDFKDILKIVSNYANLCADKDIIDTLVVIDVPPFDYVDKKLNGKAFSFLKQIKKLSKKLNLPVILVYGLRHDELKNSSNISVNNIWKFSKINKHVDKYIIANIDKVNNVNDGYIFDIDVYNNKNIESTCKLKYNSNYRKFFDI